MGLFGSDNDEGCTAHHWGEYTIDWWRSKVDQVTGRIDGEPIPVVQVNTTYKARCQHDGCDAFDTRPGETLSAPLAAFAEEANDDKFEQVVEAVDGIGDDD